MFTKVYDLTLGFPFPPTIGDRVLHNDFTTQWHGRNEETLVQHEALRHLWHLTPSQVRAAAVPRARIPHQ